MEAQVGIEIANLKEIEHQFGNYESKKLTPEKQEALAQKIAENVMNYLDSFAFVSLAILRCRSHVPRNSKITADKVSD